MGCTASRPHGRFFDSPPPVRTLSLPAPLVHHPAVRCGDSNHIVSLTSSTLGSLDLTPFPALPPPDSPLVIDAADIMAGLDDYASSPPPAAVRRSLTFHHPPSEDRPLKRPAAGRPLWKHLSEESLLADMDPAVAAVYQRAANSKEPKQSRSSKPGSVTVSRPCFETAKPAPSPPVVIPTEKVSPLSSIGKVDLPDGVDKIVVYFTTLRGIRRTYEDCCAVLNIFAGFRVAVDERDISMDSSFRRQLQSGLGQKAASLPQVFVRGKHVGGAEEIRQLLETGELTKLLQGLPVKDGASSCQSCGGVRFVPCANCNGSRKVYHEEDDQLRRCPDCNENGLVRCPDCCR